MFTVIMQVSPKTAAPLMTKDLDVKLSQFDADTLAIKKCAELMENVTATVGIHRQDFTNQHIKATNQTAAIMHVVYVGNLIIGQFSVVELSIKETNYRAVQLAQILGFDKAIKGVSKVIVNCSEGSPWRSQLTTMRHELITMRGYVSDDLDRYSTVEK